MPAPAIRSREIHLHSRPVNDATIENFETVDVELPPLTTGQVLIRNAWLSVDPYE